MTANKKTRAFIAACLLTVFLLPLLAGCSLEEITGIPSFIPEKQTGYYINGEKAEIELPEHGRVHYSALSDDQKWIYTAAKEAVELGANSFICAGIDYKEYLDIYGEALTAFVYDHPEYFWLNGAAVASAEFIEGTDYGNVKIDISIYDHWWNADLFAAQEKFNAAVEEILLEAIPLGSDYERVKYVHARLIENITFDHDSLRAGSNIDSESEALVNTAYGALIEGRAMCGGYSSAFAHIMHKLGIECAYVTGTADGEPHAWNMIKLGGEYYHMDLTWDDPDGDPADITYSYFCITDREICKTHRVDPEYNYLTANSNEYNYYVKEGLYLEGYSFNAVNEMFGKRKREDVFSVKCSSYSIMKLVSESLIDNSRFYDLDGMDGHESFKYIKDEDQYILTFFIN